METAQSPFKKEPNYWKVLLIIGLLATLHLQAMYWFKKPATSNQAEVAALRERLDAAETYINTQKTNWNKATETIDGVEKGLKAAYADNVRLFKVVKEHTDTLKDLKDKGAGASEESLKALKNDLADLKKSVTTCQDDIVRVEKLYGNTGKTDPKDLTALTKSVKDLTSKFDTLSSEHDKLAATVSTVDKRVGTTGSLDKRLTTLEKEAKWRGDLMTLLGALQNENFMCAKEGRRDFLWLNGDWTINRLPKYIEMGEKDKEWFKRYLNKKTSIDHKAKPGAPTPLRRVDPPESDDDAPRIKD